MNNKQNFKALKYKLMQCTNNTQDVKTFKYEPVKFNCVSWGKLARNETKANLQV